MYVKGMYSEVELLHGFRSDVAWLSCFLLACVRTAAGEAGVPLRLPGRDPQGAEERVLPLLKATVRQKGHEV